MPSSSAVTLRIRRSNQRLCLTNDSSLHSTPAACTSFAPLDTTCLSMCCVSVCVCVTCVVPRPRARVRLGLERLMERRGAWLSHSAPFSVCSRVQFGYSRAIRALLVNAFACCFVRFGALWSATLVFGALGIAKFNECELCKKILVSEADKKA